MTHASVMDSTNTTDAGSPGMTSRPAPCTIPDLRGLLHVPVWSATKPSAAGLLDMGRSAAYVAAGDGSLPTTKIGGRIYVPVASLLRLVGLDPHVVLGYVGAAAVEPTTGDDLETADVAALGAAVGA